MHWAIRDELKLWRDSIDHFKMPQAGTLYLEADHKENNGNI